MSAEVAHDHRDVAVAALVAVPFIVLLVILQLVAPASEAQLRHADPLVSSADLIGRWFIPAVSCAIVGHWLFRHTPTRAALVRGMKHAAAGATVRLSSLAPFASVLAPICPRSFRPKRVPSRVWHKGWLQD